MDESRWIISNQLEQIRHQRSLNISLLRISITLLTLVIGVIFTSLVFRRDDVWGLLDVIYGANVINLIGVTFFILYFSILLNICILLLQWILRTSRSLYLSRQTLLHNGSLTNLLASEGDLFARHQETLLLNRREIHNYEYNIHSFTRLVLVIFAYTVAMHSYFFLCSILYYLGVVSEGWIRILLHPYATIPILLLMAPVFCSILYRRHSRKYIKKVAS